MRRINGYITLLLGAAVIFTAMWIGKINAVNENYDPQTKRLVCIVNSASQYYWAEVKEGIQAASEEYDCNSLIQQIEYFDQGEQLRYLNETDFYHVDGIITVGQPDNEKINNKIKEITESGIPVVLLDTDSMQSKRDCYVGTDNYQAGVCAARELLALTENDVHALVCTTGMANTNHKERIQGFQSLLEDMQGKADLHILVRNEDKYQFQTDILEVLEADKEINSIFCAEASTSQIIASLLEKGNLSEKYHIICFDDLAPVPQMTAEGKIDGMLIQQAYDMGYEAVRYLAENEKTKETKTSYIYTKLLYVSGEEAKNYFQKESDE